MARGLVWLPLLVLFIWLTWAGWNEYQKLEAYNAWAKQFDRAKYDIYSVLGQKGDKLTWGKPTRKGPIELQTVSLQQVKDIQLLVNDQKTDLENLPPKSQAVAIELQLQDIDPVRIPFTEVELAAKWTTVLRQDWQSLQAQG
ncbi:hypothetical protein [Thermocoleostomius sinensis]|uniref:Uncharacterized protein n=1 Tax=Thermocoleostomius sinensis A174 TaxID=2016057 RepID=A0A9E8ZAZ9_9CYAN|nr:hypothetical protein [Thermocoleostomius sinensis]WAL59482.1 hypothetical protein OXH18_20255 [Thermocoleostomius sinensis A174]